MRYPRPHLLAFLHFAHRAVLPGRLPDGEAVERRDDGHLRGVGLGMAGGRERPIPLDLEDPNVGLRRPALEIEGLPQLGQRRLGLLERLVVLLGGDARQHLVLEDLELRPFDVALGLLELRLVARAGDVLFRLFLVDLRDKVEVVRSPVLRDLQLPLPIELDEQIALLHLRARGCQLGDDERGGRAPRESRRCDHPGPHRLHGAVDTDGADELFPLHHGVGSRTATGRARRRGVRARAARRGEARKEDQ